MEKEFNEKGAKLGLLLYFKGDWDKFDNEYYFEFNLKFVLVNDFTSDIRVRNCTKYSRESKFNVLHGIEFIAKCYINKFSTPEKPYSHYTSIYFDSYHPQLEELEVAVHSLKKIKKEMTKYEQRLGFSSDWKTVLTRFAYATKISYFVEILSGGSNFDCCSFRLHSISEGIKTMEIFLENDPVFQKEIQKVKSKGSQPSL